MLGQKFVFFPIHTHHLCARLQDSGKPTAPMQPAKVAQASLSSDIAIARLVQDGEDDLSAVDSACELMDAAGTSTNTLYFFQLVEAAGDAITSMTPRIKGKFLDAAKSAFKFAQFSLDKPVAASSKPAPSVHQTFKHVEPFLFKDERQSTGAIDVEMHGELESQIQRSACHAGAGARCRMTICWTLQGIPPFLMKSKYGYLMLPRSISWTLANPP
jgi:hypothetical protein